MVTYDLNSGDNPSHTSQTSPMTNYKPYTLTPTQVENSDMAIPSAWYRPADWYIPLSKPLHDLQPVLALPTLASQFIIW